MLYHHVDVFSATPLNGNGLTVVFPERLLPAETLHAITREFKQFETIFLFPPDSRGAYPARIFTVDEELAFAGHPILGAAALLHHLGSSFGGSPSDDSLGSPFGDEADIQFALGEKSEQGEESDPLQSGRLVSVHSRREAGHYHATMNQGKASFLGKVDKSRASEIAAALNLRESDLDDSLPLEVVSTGLPYLLVPVRSGLESSGIVREDFEAFLGRFGAKFAYVFDSKTLECRTWDNVAHTEDIATGSAAGPLCAYLVRHGMRKRGEDIRISQGRFVGRPSVITGRVAGADGEDGDEEVFVSGDVAMFASGTFAIGLP